MTMTDLGERTSGQFLVGAPDRRAWQAAQERAAAQRLLPRLWQKDAGLWSHEAAAQEAIRNRLGWLTIAETMRSRLDEIRTAAQDIRAAGFTHALLLGMGGSGLFSEVCRQTFGLSPGWLDLLLLDTTDPSAILAARDRAPLERTLFIVSSKSGTTTEVDALCEYFYDQAQRSGSAAGRQFVAITDADTPLEHLARQRAFRHTFVHGPGTGQDVGGRFSALTCFGLVPAALMGLDIDTLLARARSMQEQCGASVPIADNPAAQLGLLLGAMAAAGRDKVTLLCAPELASFGIWVEQLIAESTGKLGKGLVPIYGEPVWDVSRYHHDRIFIELQLASQPARAPARHAEALAKAGHPVVRLQWNDRYDLGADTIRWFLATAIAATAMDINPFDEPNVQESKDRTKALLERYIKEGALRIDPPDLAYAGQGRWLGAQAPQDLLRAFLGQAGPGDYVVLSSFLPRSPALDRAVEAWRARLSDTTELATTLGYGPRYLHSTGQLHKDGPDRGLFIILTADDPVDAPIPGKPYSFSVLKQAQALGDCEALRERKRRLLRVHLGRDAQDGLARLSAALESLPRR